MAMAAAADRCRACSNIARCASSRSITDARIDAERVAHSLPRSQSTSPNDSAADGMAVAQYTSTTTAGPSAYAGAAGVGEGARATSGLEEAVLAETILKVVTTESNKTKSKTTCHHAENSLRLPPPSYLRLPFPLHPTLPFPPTFTPCLFPPQTVGTGTGGGLDLPCTHTTPLPACTHAPLLLPTHHHHTRTGREQ